MANVVQDVITIESSDDEEESNPSISVPLAPAPPNPPKTNGQVNIIHFPTRPKIGPKSKMLEKAAAEEAKRKSSSTTSVKQNGTNGAVVVPPAEDIVTLSSDDEDVDEACKNAVQSLSILSQVTQPKKIESAETKDNDELDVLYDEDENKSEVKREAFSTDAAENIQKVIDFMGKHKKLKRSHKTKVEKKIWRKYKKINHLPLPMHEELSKRIALVLQELENNSGANIWRCLTAILDQFNETSLNQPFMPYFMKLTEAEKKAKAEEKKQKAIRKLEHALQKISDKIKEFDTKSVDWDREDDHNSEFMQHERLKAMFNRKYNLICKITKSSKLTGRPIQKALNLKNTTTYPEVELAVQNYVNNAGYFTVPDFRDILKIARKANIDNKLYLRETDLKNLAKDLLQEVVNKKQVLRNLDVALAFPTSCDPVASAQSDPADNDEELQRRLEENSRNGKKIQDVVNEFVERQRQDEIAKGIKPAENDESVQTVENDVASDNELSDVESQPEDDDEEEDEEESLAEDNITVDTPNTLGFTVDEDSNDAAEPWHEVLFEDEDQIESSDVEMQSVAAEPPRQESDGAETERDVEEPASKRQKVANESSTNS